MTSEATQLAQVAAQSDDPELRTLGNAVLRLEAELAALASLCHGPLMEVCRAAARHVRAPDEETLGELALALEGLPEGAVE